MDSFSVAVVRRLTRLQPVNEVHESAADPLSGHNGPFAITASKLKSLVSISNESARTVEPSSPPPAPKIADGSDSAGAD